MTASQDPIPASRGSLRDEAADWFALMRGPDAQARQDDFHRWLAANPHHREAYNRIAETFSLGKGLRTDPFTAEERAEAAPQIVRSPRAKVVGIVAVALMVAALWGGLPLVSPEGSKPLPDFAAGTLPGHTTAEGPVRLATRIGEIRSFSLADGSSVTLDTDSMILVSIGEASRDLTLLKGRARFEVAHERRPFFVRAGMGTVRAVGTVFDVDLFGAGRVAVSLIKGAVDVALKDRSAGGGLRRLHPGDVFDFGGDKVAGLTRPVVTADQNWPQGLRDYDGARLGDVITDANRYAAIPLRAGTSDIADIRISGRFRIENTQKLAANVAEVLGLAQLVSPGAITLLRDCPAVAEGNCRPVS